MAAEPDQAFTVAELCQRHYGVEPEKKHRVAVLRAMKAVAARSPEIRIDLRRSVTVVIYNSASVESRRSATEKLSSERVLLNERMRSAALAAFADYQGGHEALG